MTKSITIGELRKIIREILIVAPSSGTPLEKGTQDWEWTEMTDNDADVDDDFLPKTRPKRI